MESSVLTDNQRNNTVVEKICVEFDEEDPSVRDYLKNLGKTPEDFDTGKEYLLPSEVYYSNHSMTRNCELASTMIFFITQVS